MIACSVNNFKIVKYFIEEFNNIIEINKKNYNGTTALIFACNNGFIDIVQYLCLHGADYNCIIDSGDTPLTISSSNGFEEICIFLCHEPNILIDHLNYEGKTALLCAIEEGHISVVSTLLKCGANFNLISDVIISNISSRCSPLILACIYDELEIVQLLLQYGADTTLVSDKIISSQRSPKYRVSFDEELENIEEKTFHQENLPIPTENRQIIRSELLKVGWLPRLDIKRCCEIDDINTFKRLLEEYEHSAQIMSLLTNEVLSSTGGASGLLIAGLHGSIQIIEEIFQYSLSPLYSQYINLRVIYLFCIYL